MPATLAEGDVDLRRHYQGIRPVFLIAMATTVLFVSLDGPLFGTEAPVNALRVIQSSMGLCILLALFDPRDRSQTVLAAVVLGTLSIAALLRFFPGGFIWEH